MFSVNKKIKMEKSYCVTSGKYRKLNNHKTLKFFEKTLFLSVICNKRENEDENIFKEEELIEILLVN